MSNNKGETVPSVPLLKSCFNSEAAACPASRLTELVDGSSAVIAGYDREIPRARRERLEDLGLIPEALVTFERAAPLGDPLLFKVRGTRICLRRNEAERILVAGVSKA